MVGAATAERAPAPKAEKAKAPGGPEKKGSPRMEAIKKTIGVLRERFKKLKILRSVKKAAPNVAENPEAAMDAIANQSERTPVVSEGANTTGKPPVVPAEQQNPPVDQTRQAEQHAANPNPQSEVVTAAAVPAEIGGNGTTKTGNPEGVREVPGGNPPEKPGGEPTGPEQQGVGLTPPPTAETNAQDEKEAVDSEVERVLNANDEYKEQKQMLEGDKHKLGRGIDARVQPRQDGESDEVYAARHAQEQDDQDARINSLKGAEKKQYEEYVRLREAVRATEAKTRYDAQKAQIDKLPDGAEKNGRLARLEADYQKANRERILAVDFEYQASKRKYRKTERALASVKDTDGDRVFSDSDISSFADKVTWDQVKKDSRLVDANGDRIFPDEKAFKRYQTRRVEMNNSEKQAKEKVFNTRLEQGIGPDGRQVASKEEQRKLLEAAVSEQFPGTGKFRRGVRKVAEAIDRSFSKRLKDEHGKKASGALKRLISSYGLRGLLAPGTLDSKAKQDMAKNLRSIFVKEGLGYLWSATKRGALWYVILSLAIVALMPIVMTKTIDAVKPFGK